jgi:hypothetical protein
MYMRICVYANSLACSDNRRHQFIRELPDAHRYSGRTNHHTNVGDSPFVRKDGDKF